VHEKFATEAQADEAAAATQAAPKRVALNLRLEALRFAFLAVLIHLAKLVLLSEESWTGLKVVANALYKATWAARADLKVDIIAHETRLGALSPC
jgi:hypothetical protein